MARKITFETEVNQSGFVRGLAMMEARAEAVNGRMTRTMYEHNKRQASNATAVENSERRKRLDSMVSGSGFQHGGIAPPASQRGGWKSRLATSGSMFTSVARDSAASLASGAPITQVIAQQAPQVLQALAMMKVGMMAWTAIVSVGAVFAWHKLTQAIANATFQAEKFVKTNEFLKHRAEELKKIRYGLEDLDKAENNAEKRKIQRLRRQAEMQDRLIAAERKLAQEILNRKLIQEVQHNLITPEEAQRQMLTQQLGFAKADLAAREAAGAGSSPEILSLKNELLDAQRVPAGETDFQKQIREILIQEITADLAVAMGEAGTDFLTVVAELKANIANLENEIQQTYGTHKPPTPEEAIKSQSGAVRMGGDSLVRVGNFLGSNRGKIESLAQKSTDLLMKIEYNTRPTPGSTAVYSP